MKKFALLISILLLVVLLFGCSKPTGTDAIIVGRVDKDEITLTSYNALLYNQLYEAGVSPSILDDEGFAEIADQYRKQTLDSMIDDLVLKNEAKDQGYYKNLTSAEKDTAYEQLKSAISQYESAVQTDVINSLPSNYTITQFNNRLANKVKEAMSNDGFTQKSLLEQYEMTIAIQNMYNFYTQSIIIPNENLMAEYEARIIQDSETITNVDYVNNYFASSPQIYYFIPEGIRMAKNILLPFSTEYSAKINEALTAGEDTEALIAEAAAEIQESADIIYGKIINGNITFSEAMQAYGEDPGMETYYDGYMVCEGNSVFLPAFTEAAMALENVGDVSEMICTPYGIHIIEYSSDLPSGAMPYEYAYSYLYQELQPEFVMSFWESMITDWSANHEIEKFYDLLTAQPEE